MKKLVLAISTLALVISAAYADPIADRKAIMKEHAAAVGVLAKMANGEAPFDAAAVLTALQRSDDNARRSTSTRSFPAGSDKGDTKASPKIWEDMAGFQAAKWTNSRPTAAAVAAPAQDLEALKPQLGTLGADCGGCHETYRIKKG